jgi:DNA repair exonuclease SbcCD ATPase subunit
MQELSELVRRKFSDIVSLSDIEIETDSGWRPITAIAKTVPYAGFQVTTANRAIKCADNHILFKEGLVQTFAKDLVPGDQILTVDGIETVTSVMDLQEQVEMFDVSVDSPDHRYFSNGFLSHNTTIINAICYALYNKPFDNISLQRLINSTNATKNTLMEVRLSFEKGGVEYEIYRARGEEYRIEIKQDGTDITPGKGVTECDALIEEIIGISYELFTKTVIFSGNSPAFLQLPIAQQRQQIEELFNITMLSEKAKLLKEHIRQTESDIKVAEAVCAQQQVAIDLHNKHVNEAKLRVSRWRAQTEAEIASIEQTLKTLSTVDFDAEKLRHEERSRLQQEGAYLAAKLAPKKKDLQQLSRDLEKLMGEEAHLKDARCPYCSQSYPDAQTKLVTVLDSIDQKGGLLLSLQTEVEALESQAAEKKRKLVEIEGAIQHHDLADLLKARENVAALKSKLEQLKLAVNPHEEALRELEAEKVEAVDTKKVDDLRRRLDHQNFLLKLLTDKNSFLRRRIINQTIPFLNGRLNHYTRTLGLPHVVKFDADMSCTVSEFGRELDFGNLSAGEKKRVNTAMALAFRDVLHHLHAKTNLLLIDELDGALDQNGIDSVIRILKEKSREEDLSIFVISHHPSIQGRLDRNLRIVKEQGFSRAELE